jgi:hypothetical protein
MGIKAIRERVKGLSGYSLAEPEPITSFEYASDCALLLDLVERLGEALEECYNAVQKSNAHLPSGDESEVEALLKELEPTE